MTTGVVTIYVDPGNPKKYFVDVENAMDANIVQV